MNMKKKIFSLLVLLMAAVTGAWADIIPTYDLSVGTNDHGNVKFYVGEAEVTKAAEGATVTVAIEPNTGWVVNKPSGQWGAAIAKAPRRVDMLKDFELTKLLGQDNTWSFVMQRANAEISVTYKKLLTNADITVADIAAVTYTGQAQEPVVTVKDGSTVLVKGTDYTVSYSNNTHAALATAEKAPTVTITAVATSDKYAGETTKTFTILPKALEDGFIANIDALVYTGVAQTPEPAVTYNNMTLVKGTDFTYSYTNNVNVAAATADPAPTVTITAVANSNYSGTAKKTFTITKKALTVKADNKQVTFGDDAPQYTVSYNGFVNNETNAVLGGTLAFACDYVKNQSGAGTYDITPSGLTSSNYDITFTKGTLTVGKKALEDGFIANIASLVYNGVAQEPAPVVTFNGMTLVKGTDYSVSYENNVNVGTATATVTALANSTKYSGSASKTFTITKKALTVKADNKQVTFGDDAPTYTESYDGFVNNETKAVLSGTLALTCDYVKNQTGAGTYAIKPSGLTSDNYDITFTNGTLTVGKKALNADMIAVISDMTYTGTALTPEPAVTFNGMTLVKGTDFTYSYQNNTKAALATAENAPTVIVTAQETSTKYSGSATVKFTILQKTVGLKWGETTFDCDDTDKQPTVTVTGLVEGDECTATVEGKGKAVGSYTAEVTALSNANYQLPKKTSTDFVIVRDMSTVFSGDNAWATYVAKENLATPFGLEAYVVSAVTETAITAKSVSYIPVGVGILLKRSVAGVTSYKGEAYEGTPENIASLLKGSATAATDVTAYKDFVLYRDEFVMSSASSIAAGRACLPAASAPAGASRLDIVIDGNMTGVDTLNVKRGTVNDGSFYDLSGRKVAQPTTKGVYINNGRKVVIK